MQIQTKTAILFTLLTATVVFILSMAIYYFSNKYAYNDFYKRLELRARISAKFRFEQDQVSTEAFRTIQKQYLETLPEEKAFIVKVNKETGQPQPAKDNPLPMSYMRNIIKAKGETVYHQLKLRHFAGIFYRDETGDYLVIKSATNNYVNESLEHLRDILIVTFISSVIFIFTVGLFFSRRTFQPVRDITARFKEISVGNLHLRLPETGNTDEIAELTQTFNQMLDRLQTAFETQNNFISNASHEFRTPLTTIIGEADYALSKERNAEAYRQSLTTIVSEAEKLQQLTRGLLALAQSGFDGKKQQWETIRVDQLLFDVKEHVDAIDPANKVHIYMGQLPTDENEITTQGSYSLLRIAVGNIVMNACKYSGNRKVSVKMEVEDGLIHVTVADSGIGIPSAELKHIYDPFFRASNTGNYEGYGIGLPLANNIIRIHKGKLHVQSQEKIGTTVRISLPCI